MRSTSVTVGNKERQSVYSEWLHRFPKLGAVQLWGDEGQQRSLFPANSYIGTRCFVPDEGVFTRLYRPSTYILRVSTRSR